MTIILIRTIILYFAVLVVIRIMGKSELAKLSPFQMVILFMIAELAAIPIESSNVSLITGITAIFTLLLLQVSISFISTKSPRFKILINGKPSILIDNGAINVDELSNLRITIDDLLEQLRLKNIPSIADVGYAIMESNGDLSVIPKSNKHPLTPSDLSMNMCSEIMPIILIADGRLCPHNLKRINWDENYLKSQLLSMHIESYTGVFIAYCDENEKLHVYPVSSDRKAAVEVMT